MDLMDKKSGKHWLQWANQNAKNEKGLAFLDPGFRNQVESFVEALVDAGATVKVEATRRSKLRAYLFHWSWMISLEKCKPSEAKLISEVDIIWDHGDKTLSVSAAKDMVHAFGLAIPPRSNVAPSLTSNHIVGKAADIEIKWKDTIKVKTKDGKEVEIKYQSNPNTNTRLIEVGKSYGVIKHKNDAPHWSVNGR